MSSRRCARASAWLMALAVVCAAPAAAFGNETLPLQLATDLAPARGEYEALVVAVSVNRQSRGEFTLYRDSAGDYYAAPAELAALGLSDAGTAGRRVRIDGEEAVSLRSLGAIGFAFDEARLS